MANEQGQSLMPNPAEPTKVEKKRFGVWDFLNSQFGLWLLGSVVLGLISLGWNLRVMHENEQREDSQFLASLLPYLTHSLEERVRAAQVARGRYPQEMPDRIRDVVCNSLNDFADLQHQLNNDALRNDANEFLRGCPLPPSAAGQATPTPSEGAQQIPVERTVVYIQIYSEEQRDRAANIQLELREHYIVPGIENLSNTNPTLASRPVTSTLVRYFNDSDADAANRIYEILKRQQDVHQDVHPAKPSRLSLSVHPGTIEIWFAPTDLIGK